MTKRIDQMRYESRQTAQLLRMEEELKKTLSREERREVDLRKRTEELNLWECKLEWKKVELNMREDEQNRREDEQKKRDEEQQTKDGR